MHMFTEEDFQMFLVQASLDDLENMMYLLEVELRAREDDQDG